MSKKSIKKLDAAKATASLAEYVEALDQVPLIVTRKGKPVAALVPVEGMDWESLSLGTNPQFLDLIERSRRRAEAEGTIPSEDIRQEFGLPPNTSKDAAANGRNAKPKSRKSTTKARKAKAKVES